MIPQGIELLVAQEGASGDLPSAAEWLSRVLEQERPKQLMQLATAWHLRGRRLLNGNPVALPLVGRECLFRVRLQASRIELYRQKTTASAVMHAKP